MCSYFTKLKLKSGVSTLFSQSIFCVLICMMLTNSAVNAQQSQTNQDGTSLDIDLTEIVVTALVLSFGYGVLKSFQSKK